MKGQRSWLEGKERACEGVLVRGREGQRLLRCRLAEGSGTQTARKSSCFRVAPPGGGTDFVLLFPSAFPCSRPLILFPLLFFPPSPPSLHPFPSPSCCLSLLPSPVKLLENTFFFSPSLSLSLASRQCAEETGNSCRARKQQSTCTCVIASRPVIT